MMELDKSREHKMAESDQPLSSGEASRIHWLEDWVGHWDGPYALEKRKTSCPSLELKQDSSVVLVLIPTEPSKLCMRVSEEYL